MANSTTAGRVSTTNDLPSSQPTTAVALRPTFASIPAPRPHVPLANDRAMGMALFLATARRWWRVAIPIGALLAIAGAAIVWCRFKPEYEASAWLRFDERTPFLAFAETSEGSKAFVQTQIELIRSPLVLGPAIARPEIAKLVADTPKQEVIESLGKQLKIAPVGESELYKVGYSSSNPAAAAAIVNAVIDSYFNNQSDADRTRRIVDLLEKEKASRLKDVVRMRRELGELARRLTGHEDYTFRPANDATAKSPTADLQDKLIAAQVDTAVLEARLQATEHDMASGDKHTTAASSSAPPSARDAAMHEELVDAAVLERPEVQKAMDAIVAKVAEQKEIASRIKDGENDSMYQALGVEIAESQTALDTLKKSLRASVEKRTDAQLVAREGDKQTSDLAKRMDDLSRLRDDVLAHRILQQRLQEAYDKQLKNAKQFSGGTLELQFKHDELERAEKVFELIATRELQLQTEQMAPTRASVLRTADVPQAPVESLPLRNMALAILLGALAPCGLALAWEGWARRLGDSSDLPETLGLPVVGEIARRPPRVVSSQKSGSRQGELEFRVYRESIDNLQTALTLSDSLKAMRFIAVTSAVSFEGKTSVASQLAISLARATKQRVLLIDGDMRSPDIHRFFKIDRDPGLTMVLAKKCELADAIVKSWDERVHLLPAGKLIESPLALLAEGSFQELLTRIPDEYRYVVVDTPPVLAASESLILAKAADAALICTMRDRTRTAQVSIVRDRLLAAGCRVVGIVFNGVPTKSYLHRYGNYDYLAQPRSL